ncbi:hypothetical protein GCM10023322_25850 [Rugosimonospora acidiphila]|uniref:Uncharacterized protein n=1 Tax=Rugosimonospora acidiphila TaxID=556531 RepID=A0ABP9RSD2_9ACTN
MSGQAEHELLAALRGFVADIGALEPPPAGAPVAHLEITTGIDRAGLDLTGPVAEALVRALREYHDPRDNGRCEHCGGRRLDTHLICADCRRPNGVFGRLVMERAARHAAHGEPDTDL